MPLKPLPLALLTAARLREQAKELILSAEELEAEYGEPVRHRTPPEFMHSKKYRENRK